MIEKNAKIITVAFMLNKKILLQYNKNIGGKYVYF